MKSTTDGVTVTMVRQQRVSAYVLPLASIAPILMHSPVVAPEALTRVIKTTAHHSPSASRLGEDIERQLLVGTLELSEVLDRRDSGVEALVLNRTPKRATSLRLKVRDHVRPISMPEDPESIAALLAANER